MGCFKAKFLALLHIPLFSSGMIIAAFILIAPLTFCTYRWFVLLILKYLWNIFQWMFCKQQTLIKRKWYMIDWKQLFNSDLFFRGNNLLQQQQTGNFFCLSSQCFTNWLLTFAFHSIEFIYCLLGFCLTSSHVFIYYKHEFGNLVQWYGLYHVHAQLYQLYLPVFISYSEIRYM